MAVGFLASIAIAKRYSDFWAVRSGTFWPTDDDACPFSCRPQPVAGATSTDWQRVLTPGLRPPTTRRPLRHPCPPVLIVRPKTNPVRNLLQIFHDGDS